MNDHGWRVMRTQQGAAGIGRKDLLVWKQSGSVARRCLRIATFGMLLLTGCDFSVTNPGPVDDSFVNNPDAFAALVTGTERALSFGLNRVNFYAVVISREMIASGGTGNRGHTPAVERGELDPDEGNVNAKWNAAHRARWMAEESVRRISAADEAGFSRNPLAARALLYAGYANRLLGENMCSAVIDGGGAEPHTVHLERAQDAFTQAIPVAQAAGLPDLAVAAHAGRATVRAHLGDWAGALQDAEAIPTDFVFSARNGTASQDENNKIVDANVAAPWRSLSTYTTWFEPYYLETGDPRTPWEIDPEWPLSDGRQVPWYRETKYDRDRAAPIRLSTGREMRLLEAEGALRAGDWVSALVIINENRTSLMSDLTGDTLEPYAAGSAEETWSALKLERSYELWLEARILGYRRAWEAEATPGGLPPELDMSGRVLCFPITSQERERNPNIPSS